MEIWFVVWNKSPGQAPRAFLWAQPQATGIFAFLSWDSGIGIA
jgi:hypothetical protein